MGKIITEIEALQRARQYGLEIEVAKCIHEQAMDPWDALYEWDLIEESDYEDNDNRSGEAQYNEVEYTEYY